MFAQGMLLYSNTDLISVLVLEVKDLLPPLSIILIFLFHQEECGITDESRWLNRFFINSDFSTSAALLHVSVVLP